jgi:hypothetical protein
MKNATLPSLIYHRLQLKGTLPKVFWIYNIIAGVGIYDYRYFYANAKEVTLIRNCGAPMFSVHSLPGLWHLVLLRLKGLTLGGSMVHAANWCDGDSYSLLILAVFRAAAGPY